MNILRWLFGRSRVDAVIDTLITPPIQNPKYREHDDRLRIAAEARRVIAAEKRRQARSIESGKPAEPVKSEIRLVHR